MDIYDNYRLASYAAAADAFNKGKNVISSFLPLIESTLSLLTGSSTPFLALQHQLNTIYHVDIPKATLRYLLDSLEVQEKIQYDGRTITLTDKFKDGSIYREDESKSEIEDFFFSFSSFLARKGQMASPSELRRDVCNWVYFHSCDLAEFINGKDLKEIGDNAKTDTWEYASDLLSFLIESKSSRSSSYSSFVKIFDGAVQASLLNFTPSKIDEVINSNISFENVILDTNFVLRLLNLQSAMDSETASATLASLQANKTNIYVLSQTIQEASSSIRSFLTETAPNAQRINRILSSKTIHTSGFLSALQRGISREKFLSLSQHENMREQLEKEYAITIIDDFDDVEIKQIHIDSLIQSKGLDSYKERQALHDLTLIKYCRKNAQRE